MDHERVLRKYQTLDGRQLVGHQPVAVPYLILNINLYVYKEVSLPPLDDGILRLAQLNEPLGIRTTEVAAFLGVPSTWCDDRIVELRRQELVAIEGSTDPILKITNRGRVTLIKDGNERPESREIRAHLNLITHQLELVDHSERIRFCNCPQSQRIESVAICSICQGVGQIKQLASPSGVTIGSNNLPLPQLQKLVDDQMPRLRKRSSDLKKIRVAGLVGAPHQLGTFYRDGLLLGFHVDGSAPTIEVAIGGEIDPAITDHLKNQSWMQDLKSDLAKVPVDLTAALCALGIPLDSPDVKASLAADEVVNSANSQLKEAEQRLDQTEPGSERKATQDLIERLTKERDLAVAKANTQTHVASHSVNDLVEWFKQALRKCQKRLLIESATISLGVINKLFIDSLQDALERGVVVVLAIGMPGGKPTNTFGPIKEFDHNSKANNAINMFRKLQIAHPETFTLYVGNGKRHDKQLICDDWYVDGGKNWLSSSSGPNCITDNGTKIVDPKTNNLRWQSTVDWYQHHKLRHIF
jgi:hypothetical protein